MLYFDTTIQVGNNPFNEETKQFAIKPHSIYPKENLWKSYLSGLPSGVLTVFLI
ncbi:conserved hypothetical protein [uncultured Dysgonomonas sp.]|uniref:Uncharacterized protein n=1 Tax=uncultured Dysgonomonas sp. TaxID=206096 RepID=A0A212J041_9BACT|nr:conserved hypothetical protein [uncultured Dysgonomonas sp.]